MRSEQKGRPGSTQRIGGNKFFRPLIKITGTRVDTKDAPGNDPLPWATEVRADSILTSPASGYWWIVGQSFSTPPQLPPPYTPFPPKDLVVLLQRDVAMSRLVFFQVMFKRQWKIV